MGSFFFAADLPIARCMCSIHQIRISSKQFKLIF